MQREAAPRQTQSYLRSLFQERGLRPKNKLGQNFLVDLNLVQFLANSAEITRDDLVLEIGTGTGSLTAAMARDAGAVLSVEIDPSFHELASESLRGQPHVRLIHADVLKNKNHLNPLVLEPLAEGWKRFQGDDGKHKKLKLVANLPYAVATPVISNFLLTGLPFERMVVTVQLEIAERLIARPDTRDYGSLAILVQSLADVELLRRLPPAVFWPRPQVDSAIVRISPNAAKRAQMPDVQAFRDFLRELYSHRRKNLRGALVGFAGKPWNKEEVDRRLAELGIDGSLRAETLDRETHLKLAEKFRA